MDTGSAHKSRVLVRAGSLLGAAVCLYLWPPFHVVPLDQARAGTDEAVFDPDGVVEEVWSELANSAGETAVDAGELLRALAQDQTSAANKFGRRLGLSGKASYFVSGTGRITEVAKRSVEVALPEGGSIAIEAGPIFGNAIRDGSGLFDVNDFANSQDFNAVSAEINRRVEERVLPELRRQAGVGKTVHFLGGVEISDSDANVESLKLTPVAIEFP